MTMLKGWTLNVEPLNHFLPPPLYFSTSLSVCGKQHVSVCDHVVPPSCAGLWPNKLMLSWGVPLGVPGLCHLDPTATSSLAAVFVQPYNHIVTPQSGRLRWCRPHSHLIWCRLDPTATSSPPNLAVRGGVHPTATSFGVVWNPQPRRHPPIWPFEVVYTPPPPRSVSFGPHSHVVTRHHVRSALQPRRHPPIWPFEVVWTPPPPRLVLFGRKPHCHLVCCHLDPIATSSLAATFVQPYSHVTVNLAVWDGVDPTATSYVAIWTPQPCCHKYNVNM